MNNWCMFSRKLGILIFKGFTTRRLYKSFGVKGLRGTQELPEDGNELPKYVGAHS
jgi:hypothetical protein